MRISAIFFLSLVPTSWCLLSAGAEAELSEEAKSQAAYEAADKAAKDAEAAVAPLRAALQKADAEYGNARNNAVAKRQRATEAKNLAGEAGVKELQQAEAALAAAVKALEDASQAKPKLEQALIDARAAVAPLQQAYEEAEQAVRNAYAAAKAASDAADKWAIEARGAATHAIVARNAADAAKAALAAAVQKEQQAAAQAQATAQKLVEAETQKKAADEAVANAKNKVAAAQAAVEAAEKAAKEAARKAAQIAANAAKPEPEKKQAADEASAKRKAADDAKAAVVNARQAEKAAETRAAAAAKALAEAVAARAKADEALAAARNQLAAAPQAVKEAEEAAAAAEKLAEEKKPAAVQAAAKRKAAAEAKAALTRAQQGEQAAMAQAAAIAKSLAEVDAQKKAAETAATNAKNQAAAAAAAAEAAEKAAAEAAARAAQITADAEKPEPEKKKAADEAAAKRKAADEAKAALTKAQQGEQTAQAQVVSLVQKLSELQSRKKTADEALANAKNQAAAAAAANQAAEEAAKEMLALDAALRQAIEEAAVKRRAADQARAKLLPVRQQFERAAIQVNNGVQELARAESRKKAAEEAVENLKKRIAAAKESFAADEKAADEADAAAVPLKAEAEKARAVFLEAVKVAEQKRAEAQKARATVYRLAAAKELSKIMESPEPPKPAGRIDEIVFAKLNSLGIKPALCSDAVFLRRAYLDLTGKLPTAEEAKAFLENVDQNKRIALIDRLLDQTSHADYWAMRWSDVLRVKAEFPVKVWPNAAQAYHRWIWESIAKNKPYDQFARELLTSNGSNFRVGPVNFYRAIQDKTPEGIAAAVGLALMGTRVHSWPEDRRAGMAVFFTQIGYKPTSEWKEEIVFWDPLKSVEVPGSTAPGIDDVAKSVAATNQIPQALPEAISPNGPLHAVFPDGTKVAIASDRDPREVFADWLIRPENPWFAKNIANRTWAWAMGRGMIHEPDDIRDDNPPSNPELLAHLEKELVSSGYNLKHLKRLIFTSTTYQLSSVVRYNTPEARANFAGYPLRRVEAEVLIDAVNRITGSSDLYTSAVPEPFTYIPKDMPAVALADGSVTDSFLTLFGRSARATGTESERVNELASPQWLHMLNSGQIQNKLQTGPKLAALLAVAGNNPKETLNTLYLTILSRYPTERDVQIAEQYLKSGPARGRDAWIDITWALINNPEFLLRH